MSLFILLLFSFKYFNMLLFVLKFITAALPFTLCFILYLYFIKLVGPLGLEPRLNKL